MSVSLGLKRGAAAAALLLALGAMGWDAGAQDVFNGHDVNGAPLNDTYSSGPTPSRPTGTQGVVGNPFCPPPVEIINGKKVTPKNWSCPAPSSNAPGRAAVIGPGATACKPYGTGGYDFCQNPKGTALPKGCTCGPTPARAFTPNPPRPHVVPNGDGTYRTVTPPGQSRPPDAPPSDGYGPPGTYVQGTAQRPPDGLAPPGSYLDPSENRPPGGYLPNQPPGTYIPYTPQ